MIFPILYKYLNVIIKTSNKIRDNYEIRVNDIKYPTQ